jgi:DNA-binding CsgD family transcriptional regulator
MREVQSAIGVFQLLGLPAAAILDDGRVLAANALFEPAVPSLHIINERIILADAEVMERYDQAVDRLRHGSRESLSMLLPASENEPGAILHLVPMRSLRNDMPVNGSLVVITSLSPRTLPSIEMLHGLFDLTPAEARLARGLASGKKIVELASQFGVSPETVRSQIKHVFAKTRTRSQAELVGLLTRLPPLP